MRNIAVIEYAILAVSTAFPVLVAIRPSAIAPGMPQPNSSAPHRPTKLCGTADDTGQSRRSAVPDFLSFNNFTVVALKPKRPFPQPNRSPACAGLAPDHRPHPVCASVPASPPLLTDEYPVVQSICPSSVATPFMAPMAGPKQMASVTSGRLAQSARSVRSSGSGARRSAALRLGGVGG